MAEMDMGITKQPQQKKKKKKKKKQSIFMSIVTGLIPWKGDTAAEVLRKIVFMGSLVVLVCATLYIAKDMLKATEGGELEVAEQYVIDLKNQIPTESEIEQLPEGAIMDEYAQLYAQNNDFIGWINIPLTNVDYPVMQSEDNEYYLHHDFEHNYREAGTVFADYQGQITSTEMPNNTILYGHNMLYKYQFQALTSYRNNIDFLKKAPVINFNTLYKENKYKIFSIFITNTNEEHGDVFRYNTYVHFKDKANFYEFVAECMDRSYYQTGVDVEYGDEFLTLSTCDFSTGFQDMRLVVVARKVRENESPEVDTEKIIKKSSRKMFDQYYSLYGNTWKGRDWDTSLVRGIDEYFAEIGDDGTVTAE